MAAYTVLVTSLLTSKVLGEIPAIGVKWTVGLNGADTMSADISLSQPDDIITAIGSIVPDDLGQIGGVILRDGVIVAGGIWWTWSADFDAGTLTLSGQGWHSYVRRRTLRADKTYADQDQTSVIAKALVDYTQTAGQTPVISTSTVTASGQLRDRTWLASEKNNLGQLLEELAGDENGFSFRYDTIRNGDLIEARFITTPPTGRKTSLVFEVGKSITKLSATGDATQLATHVDGVGAGEGAAGVRTTQANASLIGVYPLLDAVISKTEVKVLSTLASYARQRLAVGKAPVKLPKATVNPNAEPVIGSYVVGDVVTTRGGYGLVTLDDLNRIVQIDGKLDQSGETLDLTYAPLSAFVDL